MYREQDNTGNVLLIENKTVKTKTGKDNIINIYIKLTSERHRRLIGVIVESKRRLHVERSEDVHLLIKANAYGFNYHILSKATKYDNVVIHEKNSKEVYLIPRETILDTGKFMFFKQQGFEVQIFLNREIIKNYKVTDIDTVCTLQGEYRLNI